MSQTTRHAWGEWETVGHGGGVVSSRTCSTCGAQEWRDTAASTPSGETCTRRGYRDAYGDPCAARPECLGSDPLADDTVTPEAARQQCPAGACDECQSGECPGKSE